MSRYSTPIIIALVVLLVVVAAMAFSAPTQGASSGAGSVSVLQLSGPAVAIVDADTKTISVVKITMQDLKATVTSVKSYTRVSAQ